MSIRAHLTKVDWPSVAFHATGAIAATAIAVLALPFDVHTFIRPADWLPVVIVAACAPIAWTAVVFAVTEVVRPGDDEPANEQITRLTNELDEARAERDELLAEARDLHGVTHLDAMADITEEAR